MSIEAFLTKNKGKVYLILVLLCLPVLMIVGIMIYQTISENIKNTENRMELEIVKGEFTKEIIDEYFNQKNTYILMDLNHLRATIRAETLEIIVNQLSDTNIFIYYDTWYPESPFDILDDEYIHIEDIILQDLTNNWLIALIDDSESIITRESQINDIYLSDKFVISLSLNAKSTRHTHNTQNEPLNRFNYRPNQYRRSPITSYFHSLDISLCLRKNNIIFNEFNGYTQIFAFNGNIEDSTILHTIKSINWKNEILKFLEI
jgi:hypothetical protein